jgi:endonuclease/exonuclease/phosphatase family metal-dependent hydrolase
MDDNEINILSYNVSWQSMTGTDPSWPLCNPKRSYKKCIKNIAKMIDLYEDKIDFVFLQEASNHGILTRESETLKKLEHVVHKSGLEEMVTYWNPKRFHLKKYLNGEFRKGRPWQLLIFKENVIIINVHAEHYSYHYLIQKLNKMLKTVNMVQYRIIIAGDFNSPIPEIVRLDNNMLYTHSEVQTCCYPVFKLAFDHVLDSKSKPILITIPKVNWLASDHKPIFVTLKG